MWKDDTIDNDADEVIKDTNSNAAYDNAMSTC